MLQPDQWKQLQGMEKHMEQEITKMIRVYGIVQGVGFRPTVSRHAMARGIRGSVSNKGPYVEIFAQGKQQDVDAFIADIGNKPPKRAAILKLLEEPVRIATTTAVSSRVSKSAAAALVTSRWMENTMKDIPSTEWFRT